MSLNINYPELNHPIVKKSFAIIDREIGEHNFSSQEYAIIRRVIHATADFQYQELLQFQSQAIESAIVALRQGIPIVTDVTMIKQGIQTMVSKTYNNPIITAIEQCESAETGKTRTETGMLKCWEQYPQAIYVIGNAPTALLALCQRWSQNTIKPALVIGVPVGFVAVLESKKFLGQLDDIPYILTKGRKGGSSVAAAIVNALCILGYQS